MSKVYPHTKRVFLADGDALVRSMSDLLSILTALYQAFPSLERVSCYAQPANLLKKTTTELALLKQHGLQFIYYGIESGSSVLLKRVTKGSTPEKMIEGLNKASEAGLIISATVILGLGGERLWKEHVDCTAELINQSQLDYLSTLQLTLEPSIYNEFVEKFQHKGVRFIPQSDEGIIQEQIRFIQKLRPAKTLVFRSNHASNALALKGLLPEDGDRLLAELSEASKDGSQLRPSWMRGL
jgi:coproporphyrinogen III oxidase-like Fe-S oxidoreductase